MPKGVVKTKKDEAAWNCAKEIVHKQYPNYSEDDDSFWKLVNSIYQNMSKAIKNIDKTLLQKAAELTFLCPETPKDVRRETLNTYFLIYSHFINLEKSYKLQGRIKFQGLDISIENRKGSVRHWYDPLKDENGTTKMKNAYGYIRLTEGADGDHVDCYIGPDKEAGRVYVIHQNDPKTGKYDEDKVMLGFDSADEAKDAYLAHYNDPKFFGSIEEYNFLTFADKVKKKKGKVTGESLQKSEYISKKFVNGKWRYKYKYDRTNPQSIKSVPKDFKVSENERPIKGVRDAFVKELSKPVAHAGFVLVKEAWSVYKNNYSMWDGRKIVHRWGIYTPDGKYNFSNSNIKTKERAMQIAERSIFRAKELGFELLKAVKVKKTYSAEEVKSLGMRWVTIRGNHVLVQQLADGGWVVVGGAGGKLNHLRIDELLSEKDYAKRRKEKVSEQLKELTPEEIKEQAIKRREEQKGKKAARMEYEETAKDILGLTDKDFRSSITADQMDELYTKARKKVEKDKMRELREADKKEVAEETEKLVKQEEKKRIKEAETQAMNVLAEDFMGDNDEVDEIKELAKNIEIDQAKELLRARQIFKKKLKQYNDPSKKKKKSRIDETYAGVSSDYDDEKIIEEIKQHIETVKNVELYEKLNQQSSAIQKHIDNGVVESLNGIIGDVYESGAIFNNDMLQAFGLEACCKIIANKLHKDGLSDNALEALVKFSRKNSKNIVQEALDESSQRFNYADEIRGMAGKEDDPDSYISVASANGYALRQITRGQQVLGSGVGSLRSMAHLINALEETPQKEIFVEMGDDLSRTRRKAKKAGLKRGEYKMRSKTTGKGFVMQIDYKTMDKFISNNIKEREKEGYVDKIKTHKENNGYIPPGINQHVKNKEGKDIGPIKLDPAQEAGLRFFAEEENVLLDFEAGMGKTAIGYAAAMEAMTNKGAKKILIVTPAKLRSQMYQERNLFLDEDKRKLVKNLEGKSPKDRAELYKVEEGITIIGHDQLRDDADKLKAANYDMIVVDEIHEMTNPSEGGDSGRFKGMMKLQGIPLKIGMSGTNIKNSKKEFYKKINFIDPNHTLGSMKDFDNKYKGLNQGSNIFQDSSNDAFRKEISKWTYTQKTELGVKNHISEVKIDMTSEQKKKYKESEKLYVQEKNSANDKKRKAAASRRESRNYLILHNGPDLGTNSKMNQMMNIMEESHPGEKAVIHAYRRKAISTAKRELEKKHGKGTVGIIHGDTSRGEVDRVKAAFNDPENPMRFLIGSKSLETGHNLQHGGTVTFHLDIPNTAAAFDQRNKRIYRKGQTKDTSTYILRSKTPFDMSKMDIMERKKREMSILGNPRSIEMNDESGFMAMMNTMGEAV